MRRRLQIAVREIIGADLSASAGDKDKQWYHLSSPTRLRVCQPARATEISKRVERWGKVYGRTKRTVRLCENADANSTKTRPRENTQGEKENTQGEKENTRRGEKTPKWREKTPKGMRMLKYQRYCATIILYQRREEMILWDI